MAAFLDGCRFNPAAGGTTDWTYSSAATGYLSPTQANIVNGTKYKYRAESLDLSQWEYGEGTYNTSTGVLARTAVLYSSATSNAKVNFSTVPQVAIVALKEDLISIEEANSFTSTQQAQARHNIGTCVGIPDVVIEEQQPSGTAAGTGSTTAFITRNLNQIVRNNGSIASLSSGQVTLPAGAYYAEYTAPAYSVNFYQARLQNITAGATIGYGESGITASASGVVVKSDGAVEFTLASTSAIAVQMRIGTSNSTSDFGRGAGFGNTEVYSRLRVWALS
jgi:hypothetical protein